MKQIYLAGPLDEGDNPYEWHENVESSIDFANVINPFTIHGEEATGMEIYYGDVREIVNSDAMLLHRVDFYYEICGAYIEAGIAGWNEIPIVVWNSRDDDVSEFLRWHSDGVYDDLDDAVEHLRSVV